MTTQPLVAKSIASEHPVLMDDTESACTFGGCANLRAADPVEKEQDGIEQLNLLNELIAADGLGEHFNLTSAMVRARAVNKFTEGAGAPRMTGEPRLATYATLWLVKLAREVVFELFDNKKNRVTIEESWGEMIDKEEAVAFLVADAVGVELLPTEARNIGVDMRTAITSKERPPGAKVKEDKIKGNAAAKKSKARKAAEKDEAKAAGLAAKIKAIDDECLRQRVELWGADTPVAPGEENLKSVGNKKMHFEKTLTAG